MIRELSAISIIVLLILISKTDSFPDEGKWSFTVSQKRCHYFEVHSALYKNSTVSIKVACDSYDAKLGQDMKIKIGWVLRETPCFDEYLGPEISMPDYLKWYYYCPAILLGDFGYDKVHYLKTNEIEVTCNHIIDLTPVTEREKFRTDIIGMNSSQVCVPPDLVCDSSPEPPFLTYFNSDKSNAKIKVITSGDNPLLINKRSNSLEVLPTPLVRRKRDISNSDYQLIIPNDGVYLLLLFIKTSDSEQRFNATVDIEMKTESGLYLSAVDWPLLPFYGVMCAVYVIYAFGWLLVSFAQWRDLLRIQFWIAAVIFLGMFEKAVFYAEYQSINSTGVSVKGAVLFAEVLSCFKRTLARMLVIIVSCGFGIVKPRLGPILHRVVCVGGLYFILGSLEATLRIYKPKNDPTNQTLMAGIPLAVLDSVICWWVFSSLVQTTRILRLRRNVVKLNLYKQFTNTLIFAVLASVAFMVWQIHNHKLTSCVTDWKGLWIDDAYWHVLFSAVLLVIMILWRPTNNNQRYAFTPLLDASDDEEEEREPQTPYEAFDGMKMRQQRNSTNHFETNNKESVISKETEDNLKWIEENIPTSLVDSALPALIDSDEEIMTTKFEMNKME